MARLRLAPDLPVGTCGGDGESEAHRALKLFVVERPGLLGLSPAARGTVEHTFRTGDRVDVLFNNHLPERTVVEIEVDRRAVLAPVG